MVKIIFISSSYRVMFFLLFGLKSEQANREHVNPAGKPTRFSRVIFFHIFASENMENTSVLVYGKPCPCNNYFLYFTVYTQQELKFN